MLILDTEDVDVFGCTSPLVQEHSSQTFNTSKREKKCLNHDPLASAGLLFEGGFCLQAPRVPKRFPIGLSSRPVGARHDVISQSEEMQNIGFHMLELQTKYPPRWAA